MQRIIYSYYIPSVEADPHVLLHVWGMNDPHIPAWQKHLVRALLPVLVKFMSKVCAQLPDPRFLDFRLCIDTE